MVNDARGSLWRRWDLHVHTPASLHHNYGLGNDVWERFITALDRPKVIATDRLKSYRAAMNVIGNAAAQTCGRWLNNRAENSHQPFRRREGAMAKFRDLKTLQTFASVHASIHNHFNHQRHLNRRGMFKQDRAAALAEWRQLAA